MVSCWVLICISLMANDIKHLFMCLLDICMSLERFLFRSFFPFVIYLFAFYCLVVRLFLYSGYCVGMYLTPVLAQAYRDVCAVCSLHIVADGQKMYENELNLSSEKM